MFQSQGVSIDLYAWTFLNQNTYESNRNVTSAAEKAHKLRWNTPGICRAEHRSPGSRPLLLTNVTVPLHNEYYLAAAVVDNIQEGLMCWQLCTNKWVKATFGTLDYKQHEDNDSNLDCGLAPLNRANSISAGSRFACVSWRLTGQVRGMCCVICRPEHCTTDLNSSSTSSSSPN